MIKASCLPIAANGIAAESRRNPRAVAPVPREAAFAVSLRNRRALLE
jgi:hypothetical protein